MVLKWSFYSIIIINKKLRENKQEEFVCTNMSINCHTCFCKVVLCIQTLNLGLVIRETKMFSENQRLLIQKPKSVFRARVDHHHWMYYSIYFPNSTFTTCQLPSKLFLTAPWNNEWLIPGQDRQNTT